MGKTVIRREEWVDPADPYSRGISTEPGRMVFTAGQVPVDYATGNIVQGDIKDQTRQVCENLRAVVAAAGASLEDIVKVTVFMTDLRESDEMNKTRREFFPSDAPAASLIGVTSLAHPSFRVEIEAIAVISA